MATAKLVQRSLLDPREAAVAAARPISDAVNIPFSELPARTHELPDKRCLLRVAGPQELARAVVTWLEHNGRRAAVAAGFRHAAPPGSPDVGRLWAPNAFLADVLARLPRGSALDLACGTGRDAVFMASAGWDVTAVDILPDALDRARELGRRCAAAIRAVRWIEADLEIDRVAGDRRFDLIAVIRYLHRPLLARLGEWLRPGGSLVCETFTTLHRARHGRPTRDAHVLQRGELPRLLRGLEVRHYSETWRAEAHTARLWAVARRP